MRKVIVAIAATVVAIILFGVICLHALSETMDELRHNAASLRSEIAKEMTWQELTLIIQDSEWKTLSFQNVRANRDNKRCGYVYRDEQEYKLKFLHSSGTTLKVVELTGMSDPTLESQAKTCLHLEVRYGYRLWPSGPFFFIRLNEDGGVKAISQINDYGFRARGKVNPSGQ